MNTFYIVRHGETENNKAGRLSGWADTPLTEDGLRPTKKVISKLANVDIDEVYSSDVGRAFITAYVIARGLGFDEDINRLPGLRDVNYGDAANMFCAEAYELYPGLDRETNYTPPNGESLGEMQKRVFRTLHELDSSRTSAKILLVCHFSVLAAIQANFLGCDLGEHNFNGSYPHDYVGVFTFANGRVTSFEELHS